MGRKLGRLCPFGRVVGGWVPIYHSVARAEAYPDAKWHLDPSSRLATTDMGQKLGEGVGQCPLWGRSWVPI